MNLAHAIKSICQCGFITDAPMFSKRGADVGSYDGRSLMFDSGSSQYLSRTPGVVGNTTRWSFSCWVKRSLIGSGGSPQQILAARTGSNASFTVIQFNQVNTEISINDDSTADSLLFQGERRDVSGFYHILVVVDTGQAVAADRTRVYVNSDRLSITSGTPLGSSITTAVNNTVVHSIGRQDSGIQYFDGYMADIVLLDGIAASPTDFGYTSADTGEWVPKAYTGSYGTNGFHLKFDDTTSFTTLGADSSGNGNDFTLNNYSGTTTDWSVLDTPVDGYPVLNTLTGSSSGLTFSEGNLHVDYATATGSGESTFQIPRQGKWYAEVTIVGLSGGNQAVGLSGYQITGTTNIWYLSNANIRKNGVDTAYGASYSTGDIIGIALDVDNNQITFYKNNVSQGTESYTFLDAVYVFRSGVTISDETEWDFGQRGFTYTPPTGFKALSTANMPERKTLNPRKFFTPLLYTGNGSTQEVDGALFQPDFGWFKNRDSVGSHRVYDSVRGVDNRIFSDLTNAEETLVGALSSFDSDGVTFGGNGTNINNNGDAYVAYLAKISALAGFDIQSYTGDGVAGRTVAHNLGKVPDMMVVKGLSAARSWPVYVNGGQVADPETDYLILESTNAFADIDTMWNDTAPTNNVFSLGTTSGVNNNGENYIAYLFADDGTDTIYVVGSYTGNGSADGPFVYTRGRPQWVMIKDWSTLSQWTIFDSARDPYNLADANLYANLNNAEGTGREIDILSNGFKNRATSADINESGATFIFIAALASHDKYARAR